MKANIGLIGLAVMGQNLVLNMNDHGFKVAVFNRTTSTVDEFLDGPAKNTQIIGTHSLEELIDSLESPRIIMLMVKAGEVVDQISTSWCRCYQPAILLLMAAIHCSLTPIAAPSP